MYGNPVAPSEVELTFNPSFYPSLVRKPMAVRFLALMKSLDDSVELCTDNWIFSAYENIVRF